MKIGNSSCFDHFFSYPSYSLKVKFIDSAMGSRHEMYCWFVMKARMTENKERKLNDGFNSLNLSAHAGQTGPIMMVTVGAV